MSNESQLEELVERMNRRKSICAKGKDPLRAEFRKGFSYCMNWALDCTYSMILENDAKAKEKASQELPPCKEQPTHKELSVVPYQLCPKCEGTGEMLIWPGEFAMAPPTREPCNLCNGAMVIPMYITTPVIEEA